ncbi:choice-of-anchor I family protein [Paenibacillus endoradicis]|uniref:choice-of-anchor I family protein n=1 Tax=Paenibacillus endoradicis TaxID=2972487 RepID=UPI002158BAF9|nr:choice-of-anchor I family protein [Paenibacillus endoradicis]MCR8656741.1 choice-of-anchor I family protein [Paenibacillus endoradicis]
MGIIQGFKKVTSGLIIASIVSTTLVPAVTTTYAQALATLGTPYNEAGEYDVTVPHIVIQQIYGAGLKTATDSLFSHGFIELYNPTNDDVDLSDWSLQYSDRGSNATTGATNSWEMYPLEGTIPAHSSYLIIGKATGAEAKTLIKDLTDKADHSINRFINNKGLKVALVHNTTVLTEINPFDNKQASYVDLVGSGSNDDGSDIDGYETAYPSGDLEGTSKKKAIIRKLGQDNDNNKKDFVQLDYSSISSTLLAEVAPRGTVDEAWTPTYPPAVEVEPEVPVDSNLGETLLDSIAINKISEYKVGVTNEDGGVAEIVKFNKDNGKFYLVNGSTNPPSLEIVSLTEDEALTREKSIDVQLLAEHDGFQYGDLTSVNVNTIVKEVVVSVAEQASDKAGKVLVLDYDGKLLREYEVGIQPDMITRTTDGKYIMTANEGEPRDAGIDPKGSVSIIDTTTGKVKNLYFDNPSIIDDNVIIRGATDSNGKITTLGSKADALFDLEPEYITISEDGNYAYVALQENNAIATISMKTQSIISVKGLGYKDLSAPSNALDVVKDDKILLENVPFKGMYMPDGIASYTINGVNYIFTANEGDATGWDNRSNESKVSDLKASLDSSSAAAQFLANTKTYDKLEAASGMPNDSIYLYGARSFSIWDSSTMAQVYDSGSEFERVVGQRLPEYFNVSNSNTTLDSRSTKKGPEPEDVKIGKVGSQLLAFIGFERVGGVAVYNVTEPSNAHFVNYTNTRDYTKGLDTDSAPEGLEFISATDSPTRKPILLVAHEVGGTVAVYELDVATYSFKSNSYSYQQGATVTLVDQLEGVTNVDTDVVWSSSNTNVATVDEAGIIKLKNAGTVTITATSQDGYSEATATIESKRNNSYVNNGEIETPSENNKPEIVNDSANNRSVVTSSFNTLNAITGTSIDIVTNEATITLDKQVLADLQKKLSLTGTEKLEIEITSDATGSITITAKVDGKEVTLPLDVTLSYSLPTANSSIAGLVIFEQLANGKLIEIKDYNFDSIKQQIILPSVTNGKYMITYTDLTFSDLQGNDVKTAIQYMLARNWINGVSEQSFAPKGELSRAQLVTILARIAGADQKQNSSTKFTDINNNAYYANGLNWAVNQQIVNGISATQFGPQQQITREQMAVFMYRFMMQQGFNKPTTSNNEIIFEDSAQIASYSFEAIQYLASLGIIQGYATSSGNLAYKPQQALTREEGMLLLYRMMQINK